MSSEQPVITFYDIASKTPSRTFAANPWKTRFALNYKKIPYKTEWVQMPDIHNVREKLGVPANRTHANGTPYHTLPVIHDPSTGQLIGDSFEIAQYLDATYPSPTGSPTLFRPNTIGLTAAHNAHIDGIFTKYAMLCTQMPFDAEMYVTVKAIFATRAGVKPEDMNVTAKQRSTLLPAFEAALGELAKAYYHTGGTTDYFWLPKGTAQGQRQRGREVKAFLDGDEPVYADFIIGAWLKMFEASMLEEDWKLVRSWQGGLWGRVVDALQPWAEIK